MKPNSTDLQAFSYTASVKLVIGSSESVFQAEYPGVTDISVSSREFTDYNECLSSCKVFMEDMKTKINVKSSGIIFKVGSEINPVYSGQPTLSKDWDHAEVARLWLYDEKMEKIGQIHAVGQARVYTNDHPVPRALAN